MGLFDEVRCDYPLPNPEHQDLKFQTKDLENLLDEYVVTRRGRLVRETEGGPFDQRRCHVVCPIHKDVSIYTSVEVAGGDRECIEYVFRFTEGRVTRVRRSPDRRRFKVREWNPSESGERTPAYLPVGEETAGRLAPGLHPRRPTAQEFSDHTPEKLELIDGEIPGGEKLLLLLLTSLGLRRAAGLVGDPKRWRAAAAPVRVRGMVAGRKRTTRKRRKT